jgi:hypothetical protein
MITRIETISMPRELTDEMAEVLSERLRVCGGIADDIWEALKAAAPVAERQEPVQLSAVAVVRERDDELRLDWLLEGGIAELEPGQVLIVADRDDVTDDEGSGELYTSPPAPVSVDAAKAFAKGFNALEQAGGKYRINMQFANRDDAWAAYTSLGKLNASLAKPQ